MQAERDAITPAYVEEMLDEVARRTGYRMANDRFGFVPALLAIDRERAASARPATPGDGAVGLAGEVANLQARLADSEAERCKMADTAVAGWVEHSKLRWDAEERAAAAEARAEAAEDRFKRLLIAFHDATRRPTGVTPASGDEFYDWRLAEAAEERRPRYGTDEERRERPEVRLVAAQREKRAAELERDGLRAENERLRQGKDRFKAGVRAAVTFLHKHADKMVDPHARGIINSAAFTLGVAHEIRAALTQTERDRDG